ncbi:MAG: hypothetical protein ABIP48_18710 [Planctomycetota bacterium]
MAYLRKQYWAVWLAIGLLVGLMIGGIWPDTPLHAVSTDSTEHFAIATGFVDDGVEAVYFLDFLTGTLRAAVLSNQSRGFQARYEANINADLAGIVQLGASGMAAANAQRRKAGLPPLPQMEIPQSPRYLITTGVIDIRRGAAARQIPAQAVLYVAEVNTGIVLTYIIPWDRQAHNADLPAGGPLTLWAGDQFTTALIQTE